ncbi:MAG: hypothetical protein SFW35_06485 [Chitinophagales bacterium]|nr:hypothetical protein [Chitinophagales bacterium]
MKSFGYLIVLFAAYLYNGIVAELGLVEKAKPYSAVAVTAPVGREFVKDSSVVVFIRDLEGFVHSVADKKGQYNESYWAQTDELWQALQDRKKGVEAQFTDKDRDKVLMLEQQYQLLKNTYTKPKNNP